MIEYSDVITRRSRMFHLKGYLKTFLPLAVFCYAYFGQAVSEDCQTSFFKYVNADQMVSRLQSSRDLQYKEQALKFFETRSLSNLNVHMFLMGLLKREPSAELRQAIVYTLAERRNALNQKISLERNPLKIGYSRVMIGQIEKSLKRALRDDPSTDLRISIIDQEPYVTDHRMQEYLVQFLDDTNVDVQNAVQQRLKSILSFYLERIKGSIENVANSPRLGRSSISYLARKELQYDPLLHESLSHVLQKSASKKAHSVALDLLNIIHSIESLKLQLLHKVQQEAVSDVHVSGWAVSKHKFQKRAESTIRYIQRTLMDVIQGEIEGRSSLVISSIQILGKTSIFDRDIERLLKDLSEDDSHIRTQNVAQRALDELTFRHSNPNNF